MKIGVQVIPLHSSGVSWLPLSLCVIQICLSCLIMPGVKKKAREGRLLRTRDVKNIYLHWSVIYPNEAWNVSRFRQRYPTGRRGPLLNCFFIWSQNTFVNQPSRNTRTSCQETPVYPPFLWVTNANKQFRVTKMTAFFLNAPLKALYRETGNATPHSFKFSSLLLNEWTSL